MSVSYHRALANRSRVDLVEELHAAGEPLNVRQLALRLGLSMSTVRSHLAVLEDAGLVRHQVEGHHAGAGGRPRYLYRTVQDGPSATAGDCCQLVRTLSALIEHTGVVGDGSCRPASFPEPSARASTRPDCFLEAARLMVDLVRAWEAAHGGGTTRGATPIPPVLLPLREPGVDASPDAPTPG